MKIAYFASKLTDLSLTFVHHEIKYLQKYGLDIIFFSNRRVQNKQNLSPDAEKIDSQTFYLTPLKFKETLCCHAFYFSQAPIKYLKALLFAFTRPYPTLKQFFLGLGHFLGAAILARRMEQEKCTHVHVHFAFAAASVAMFAARLSDLTYSLTVHGSDVLIRKILLADKLKGATFIVAISNYTKEILLSLIPELEEKKISVIRCGVDPENWLKFEPQESLMFRIISVGRMVLQKNYALMLQADAILVRKGFTEFVHTIIGDGPESNNIKILVDKLGLSAQVKLVGAVAHQKVMKYYENADLMVSSSLSEGIPVALMEAMFLQIPVVATRITGVPELIKDGENGFLVEADSPEQLAEVIIKVASDKKLAKNLGSNAKDFVAKSFNVQNSAQQLLDLFKNYVN